jgi:hypothetical protein
MKTLDAVNTILPMLGTLPVTSLDTKNPTVSKIQAALLLHRQSVLAVGWWFNRKTILLYPDSSGNISAPANTLSLYNVDSYDILTVVDGLLYSMTADTNVFSGPVHVSVILDVPTFDALPASVALYVMYLAAFQVYVSTLEVDAVARSIEQQAVAAAAHVAQENLRQQRYSTTRGSAWQRICRALG